MALFETAARVDTAGILLPLMVVFGCGKKPETQDRYLVTLGSCNDCHTPGCRDPTACPCLTQSGCFLSPIGLAQVNGLSEERNGFLGRR
jgi:hypothetical protein